METKEIASRSIPCSTANSTQPRSPSVAAGAVTPGMFIPLCEESVPPTSTSAVDAAVFGLAHAQADRAVGEVDELVLAQRGDAGPGDRDRLRVALDRLRRQLHVHAGLQLGDVVAQLADPQLRPRQVAEHRDLAADPLGRRADRLDRARVALAVGVGEVEAEDVGAGLDQAHQDVVGSQLAGPTVAMIFVRLP